MTDDRFIFEVKAQARTKEGSFISQAEVTVVATSHRKVEEMLKVWFEEDHEENVVVEILELKRGPEVDMVEED